MGKKIQESLSYFADRVSDSIKSNKKILVTTHIDCDGLTSGSIITKALIRKGAKCTVRTTNEFSHNLIEKMQKETRDLHIITDLGGGFGNVLDEKLGDNWIVLDPVSYTHLRAHETLMNLVCRLLLEKKKT